MDKETIINYCINSPQNTNPAVLRSMLNSAEDGGGAMILNIEYILNPDIGDYLATITNYTVNEINEAYLSGKTLICKYEDQEYNRIRYHNICFFEQGSQGCSLSDGDTYFSNEADPMVYAQVIENVM